MYHAATGQRLREGRAIAPDRQWQRYLNHEAGDDAVEHASEVAQRKSARAFTPFPSAKRAEVLDGLGHGLAVESHDDAPRGLAADVDIEEDLVKWLKLVF